MFSAVASAMPFALDSAAVAAVRTAVTAGRNLLITGADGRSRTALLRTALAGLPRRPLYVSAATGGGLYRQALLQALPPGEPVPHALGIASLRCRHQLERALRNRPFVLVWDPARPVPPALAQALVDLLRTTRTPLLASAADLASVGRLAGAFTGPQQRLHLDGLPRC